jgi:hypothetical protein
MLSSVTALLALATHALSITPSAPEKHHFPVYVKTLTGRIITVYVPSSAAVLDLKSAIHLKEPCHPEFQRFFAGQNLLDLQVL